MIASLKSSFLLLWRPRFALGAFGAAGFFSILATFVTFSSAKTGSHSGPPGSEKVTVAMLQHSDGIVYGVTQAVQFLSIIGLAVFAMSITAEYSNGTLRNLLVRQPRRLQLFFGRFLALSIFVAVLSVAVVALASLAALIVAPMYDVSTSAWTASSVLEAWPLLAVAMIGFGSIGLILGLIFKSPAATIAVGVAYLLPFEAIISGAWDESKWVMPGRWLTYLAQGGSHGISVDTALALSLVLITMLVAFSHLLFVKRDVAN